MRLKQDVRIQGLSNECLFGMMVADSVFRDVYHTEMVITCVTEGTHMYSSEYYKGDAFDCRVSNLPPHTDPVQVVNAIHDRLGTDFDVLYEDEPPHIHIEFDPKRTINR